MGLLVSVLDNTDIIKGFDEFSVLSDFRGLPALYGTYGFL
jgi:hypothetical protein